MTSANMATIGECDQGDALQIINLSNHILSAHESSVLSKGLTFSPVPQMDKFTLIKDLFLFCRKIVLQVLHNKSYITPFSDQTEQRVFQDLMDLLHEGEEDTATCTGASVIYQRFISFHFIFARHYFGSRNFYLQVSGVAMGARCAPALANLFLGWWESTVVYKSAWFHSKLY
ncbi:uncharacterized protein LOC143767879 [Ranitomeya variabilis]|uniref:uncharacterized protein LOC143767879 n=1 Tax=Ranitomeya variabilis TaxID=490064 RepID=UPI0040567F51